MKLRNAVMLGLLGAGYVWAQDHATHSVAPAGVEKLGKVTFPTSCAPAVQAQFETGVAMLHSYWFNYARKTFEAVVQQDPNCALAYWGIAVDLLGNSLVGPPSSKDAEAASAALEKARAIDIKTQRERDWIDAISAYYRDYEKVPLDARLTAYNNAMERITQRYPDDYEAWVFYALTLQASASSSDVTYASQLKSAAILEKMYLRNPQHPGVSHFLIHAYDYPRLAEKGLPAAKRFAGIAPAVPHARHMPSHIYSMLGMWEDSIASNASSLEIQPDYYHASDFTVYAHLQLAQDGKAAAMRDKSVNTPIRGDRPPGLANYTALASMPARYMLERADWAGAAQLPVTSSPYPQADSLIRFARGLGKARSGDVAGAKGEIEAMQSLQSALLKKNDRFWAERTQEQITTVSAWIAFAEGAHDQALKLMSTAADSEDGSVKNVAMENRLYPMRELMADMLIEMKQPAAALSQYRTSLKETPNRYRGVYGAALAAQAVGDRQNAADYFAKLVMLSRNADTVRPELSRAKAYLASL
jgi:tetratricopeptide (TPR) repeat protein